MHIRKKVVSLLILLNIIFILVFFIALSAFHRHVSLIAVGLPYLYIDWIIIALALGSMAFVDYQLFRM